MLLISKRTQECDDTTAADQWSWVVVLHGPLQLRTSFLAKNNGRRSIILRSANPAGSNAACSVVVIILFFGSLVEHVASDPSS